MQKLGVKHKKADILSIMLDKGFQEVQAHYAMGVISILRKNHEGATEERLRELASELDPKEPIRGQVLSWKDKL